jgi:predicted negative regulator of RcsB-dependent stress response
MAYDLEEQEQLDELKAWWKTYGKMVSGTVLGLLVAYAAYQGWNLYQGKQAVEASSEFQALQVADEKDVKTIQSKAAVIMYLLQK